MGLKPIELMFHEMQLDPEQWKISAGDHGRTLYTAKLSGITVRFKTPDGIWQRLVKIEAGRTFWTDGSGHANVAGLNC